MPLYSLGLDFACIISNKEHLEQVSIFRIKFMSSYIQGDEDSVRSVHCVVVFAFRAEKWQLKVQII